MLPPAKKNKLLDPFAHICKEHAVPQEDCAECDQDRWRTEPLETEGNQEAMETAEECVRRVARSITQCDLNSAMARGVLVPAIELRETKLRAELTASRAECDELQKIDAAHLGEALGDRGTVWVKCSACNGTGKVARTSLLHAVSKKETSK